MWGQPLVQGMLAGLHPRVMRAFQVCGMYGELQVSTAAAIRQGPQSGLLEDCVCKHLTWGCCRRTAWPRAVGGV